MTHCNRSDIFDMESGHSEVREMAQSRRGRAPSAGVDTKKNSLASTLRRIFQ